MKPNLEDLEDALEVFRAVHYFPLVHKTQAERELLDALITFTDALQEQYEDHCRMIEEREM